MVLVRVAKYGLLVTLLLVLTVTVMGYNIQRARRARYDSLESFPDWQLYARFIRGGLNLPELKQVGIYSNNNNYL